ncbi:hypothetical protein NO2_0335 [Candidatus Termititenax persephonae]|uniref:DUF4136 domain-containing protein n=1 Tax=Candidatus Termititenax persephonae TaxID=2218525 RepID=A0A388TG00_9BACT|nr:hypothetical protein NO2_0335 [Candidatus Termititenax persephonae]
MKKIKLILLAAALLFLTGCNGRLVVKNAEVDEIIPQFKEFVALYGYNLTYANDKTGAYRVEMGQVYLPAQAETVYQRATIATENLYTTPPLNSYAESTWKTVSARDRYVLVAVMARVTQRDADVVIQLDSTESIGPSSSQVNLLRKFFRDLGYQAEFE